MNISREEFAAYEIEKAAFIAKRDAYDYLLNNYTMSVSGTSDNSLLSLMTSKMNGSIDDTVSKLKNDRPQVPYRPYDYKGPKLSMDDAFTRFGYGKLSAGMLKIDSGGKSFGVLGQGNS